MHDIALPWSKNAGDSVGITDVLVPADSRTVGPSHYRDTGTHLKRGMNVSYVGVSGIAEDYVTEAVPESTPKAVTGKPLVAVDNLRVAMEILPEMEEAQMKVASDTRTPQSLSGRSSKGPTGGI